MNKLVSINDKEYANLIRDIKERYRQSQIKAAVKVNAELIQFNWMLGKDIVDMHAEAKWGTSFFETLSRDLKKSFSNAKGFSPRNLIYMKQFYSVFPAEESVPQVGAQFMPQVGAQIFMVPWNHIKLIIDKCSKDKNKALFYVNACIKNNWSRAVLMNQISSNLYERQGKAITNFDYTLPAISSDLAKEITKDPYNFDFIEVRDDYDEKELKIALIKNIEQYLLELGTGFAYMGKEYRINVGKSEEFIDMLFYNTSIHAHVVIEIKVREFQPGDVGQLGTYVVAVDHLLKTDRDEKTIGLLICKEKDQIKASYALESSSQPIGVSSYELSKLIPETFKSSLPTIEELEDELNGK